MTREYLEENQTWLYVTALAIGAGVGLRLPGFSTDFTTFISPVLAITLYAMFAQIPFLELREAFENRRFSIALCTINFLVVPVVVWLLSHLLPQSPPLLLGVYLVLLTPCIDYVVVFTHLGRGNARLTLASTPLLLLAQMFFLPFYLWLFMGKQVAHMMSAEPFLQAFLILIAFPLGLALGTELWAKRRPAGVIWLGITAWFPVPFMALTLFLVVASQISRIEEFLPLVSHAVPVYICFLAVMPLLARLTARAFRLETRAGRSLIFSAGTRNSLVVLALALSLPQDWISTSAVIVTQTLTELIGELIYIRLIPSVILRDPRLGVTCQSD